MEKERLLSILFFVILIVLFALIYFNYLHILKCNNKECFSEAIVGCKRTSYTDDNPETILQYKINGRKGDKCSVDIKVLQIKKGDMSLSVLENKEMNCLIPLGVLTWPERNLEDCHGELKESIQEIVINRMHSQIVENLGKINQTITKVI